MNDKQRLEWQTAFENKLNSIEKKEYKRVTKYYNDQYFKGYEVYLSNGDLSYTDLIAVFEPNELVKIYEQIYENIGYSMAVWYVKFYENRINKFDIDLFSAPWIAYFRSYGMKVAAARVTLVSGTAKKTLIRVLKGLINDDVYVSEGAEGRARMFRRKFNIYSIFQSERLVRTEGTNAANLATLTAATDIFDEDDLLKEWISALDERTRPAHAAANGQIKPFKQPFIVDGENLQRPADPSGSAGNVINCRCSSAPFPRDDAYANNEFDNIEFGLANG